VVQILVPQPPPKYFPNHKCKRGAKKVLTVAPITHGKLKEDVPFLEDEDEEHMGTSNKGASNKSRQNDQIVNNLLKKPKKKSHEKFPISYIMSIYIKTKVSKQVQAKSK
jgi:hypothetical protein